MTVPPTAIAVLAYLRVFSISIYQFVYSFFKRSVVDVVTPGNVGFGILIIAAAKEVLSTSRVFPCIVLHIRVLAEF